MASRVKTRSNRGVPDGHAVVVARPRRCRRSAHRVHASTTSARWSDSGSAAPPPPCPVARTGPRTSTWSSCRAGSSTGNVARAGERPQPADRAGPRRRHVEVADRAPAARGCRRASARSRRSCSAFQPGMNDRCVLHDRHSPYGVSTTAATATRGSSLHQHRTAVAVDHSGTSRRRRRQPDDPPRDARGGGTAARCRSRRPGLLLAGRRHPGAARGAGQRRDELVRRPRPSPRRRRRSGRRPCERGWSRSTSCRPSTSASSSRTAAASRSTSTRPSVERAAVQDVERRDAHGFQYPGRARVRTVRSPAMTGSRTPCEPLDDARRAPRPPQAHRGRAEAGRRARSPCAAATPPGCAARPSPTTTPTSWCPRSDAERGRGGARRRRPPGRRAGRGLAVQGGHATASFVDVLWRDLRGAGRVRAASTAPRSCRCSRCTCRCCRPPTSSSPS